MLGQLGEQVSLLGISSQIADQGALGSIRAELFHCACISFIAIGSVPDLELYRFVQKLTELIAGFS
ncbi:hypothetical protein M2171_004729 [Bradyrhizobium japonicum USDA 38]|uniref:hypothetical protein n=1 Tax=Bradyrhizobium japonicum TaxID=375 RepID=UPI0012BB6C8C|nr:hypothetical protein [Bradyrhizobium japonicum]MCS3895596.1 hypothetical protein [Bradyrhizobium japonicum USDA 38]MCS3948111.1 hypothetical protein [Bradyrhizobium japonicum]